MTTVPLNPSQLLFPLVICIIRIVNTRSSGLQVNIKQKLSFEMQFTEF